MRIEQKARPPFFRRVAEGSKNFWLIDDNSSGVQVGDTLVLREWDDTKVNPLDAAERGYTDAEPLEFRVGYVHVLSSREAIVSLLPPLPARKGVRT